MSDDLSALIEQFKSMIQSGDDISPDASRKMLLALSLDTHAEVKRINGRLKKVEQVTGELEKNPSLIWLLRYKTKQTLLVIGALLLIIFAIFQLTWHYGIMPELIEWLGLPPLLP